MTITVFNPTDGAIESVDFDPATLRSYSRSQYSPKDGEWVEASLSDGRTLHMTVSVQELTDIYYGWKREFLGSRGNGQ